MTQIRESKFKVGDVVNVGHATFEGGRVTYPGSTTITEVVYDLQKHQPNTHMYVTQGGENLSGLWFEEELSRVEE